MVGMGGFTAGLNNRADDTAGPKNEAGAPMKHWVAHECYLMKDADIHDPERAALHLSHFDERFGPRPNLQALTAWSTSPPGRRTKVRDY